MNKASRFANAFLITAIIASFVFSIALFLPVANAATNSTYQTSSGVTGGKGRVINGSPIPAPTPTPPVINANILNESFSSAFQNGVVVTLVTFKNTSICYPALAAEYPGNVLASQASGVTQCEIGSAIGVNVIGAQPRWNLIPSFAGFSIYGFTQYGSTANGFPTYNGMTIATQCTASGTANSCGSSTAPKYFFSIRQALVENAMGISGGIGGLPEGVLPNAANDKIVPATKNDISTNSYLVRVAVFDPNIFPNATTGKCTQWAVSNLSNPTGNCLVSQAALQAALTTTDNAVAVINANNLLWTTAQKPMTQAALITYNGNFTSNLNISVPNTNLLSYSFVQSQTSATSNTPATGNSFPPNTVGPQGGSNTVVTTPVTNSTQNTTNTTSTPISYGSGSSMWTWIVVAIIVIVIIVAAAWYMMKGKK